MSIRFALSGLLFAGVVFVSVPCFSEALAPKRFSANEPVFNGKVYIEQWGDPRNPPVVLVHGLGDSGAQAWRNLAPELAKTHFVVTFDLPGFGRSQKGNHLYSPYNYTRFLDWVVDTYVEAPFALVGHSMGGAIALNYASTRTRNVNRLILIDAAGILHRAAYSSHLLDTVKPGWWWDVLPATNSEKMRALLGFDLADLERYPIPLEMLLYTSMTRDMFLGGEPTMIAGLALVQHDFSGLLERVSAPTLVIWGELDSVTPLRTGRLLAERLPDARLVVIRGAAHVPMTETPGILNRLVTGALRPSAAPAAAIPASGTAVAEEASQPAECLGESDRRFSGKISTLTIVQCRHVTIENADIELLEIRASSVDMYASRIHGDKHAITIEESMLVATGSDIMADVPLVVDASRLDFAGVRISARERSVDATGSSTALFSVSDIDSPTGAHVLHGVYELSATRTLP